MASSVRLFSLFLAFSLFYLRLAAQPALLFEISGKNLAKTSFLFGTIHMICPEDFHFSDSVKTRIRKADEVLLEIYSPSPAAEEAEIQKHLFLEKGKHLNDHLSKPDSAYLDGWLRKNLNVGLQEIGKMKPLGILSSMYLWMLNCQPEFYEASISNLAREYKKNIAGLETIEQQMGFLDKVPVAEQVSQLVSIVRNPEKAQAEFQELVNLYKQQDNEKLYTLLQNSETGSGELSGELLDKRNQNWISSIRNRMKTSSCFIAVGAGHLGGPFGLVALLKKDGYKIKPIRW